ncbi:MAG: hypothetical protein P1S60_15345 [Anaerolineae bacterium]|nr:hypothetical protein [Anaerolineae bacterium]
MRPLLPLLMTLMASPLYKRIQNIFARRIHGGLLQRFISVVMPDALLSLTIYAVGIFS